MNPVQISDKGVITVATKSILRNVNIRDRKGAAALARAMENAASVKSRPVEMSRPVSEATKDEIRKMFGDRNG